MKKLKWGKITKASNEAFYLEKLARIAETILAESKNLDDRIDVMGGKAGVALFLFYYAKYTKEEKYYDHAMELLNAIFDKINEGSLYHTFAGGLAGITWMVDHLIKEDFIDADSDELLEDVDPFLFKMMMLEIEEKHYDFLHGALGIGTYFLNRVGNEKTKDFLPELIDWLDKISIKDKTGGIKWESLLNRDEGLRGFNLSLSHGISSIIVFLSKIVDAGIRTDKTSALLDGAVEYLLRQSLDTEKFSSHFPSWVAADYPPAKSRLAWCYGDLGNMLALWQAAQSTANKKWEEKALSILAHAVKRRDVKENMVLDAGLCHGGAGIAHIFNRMFHRTGIDASRDTADYWYEQTLRMAIHDDGFAGYKVWRTEQYGGWITEIGFLEGIAGIGLAFLSAVSDIEPGWDRALLMS